MFSVYILASKVSRTLYVGVTNSIERRVWEHKTHQEDGFTSQYKVQNVVYFETFSTAAAAIDREKEIKGWRRSKKIALIESTNPKWLDLSVGWYQHRPKEFRIRPGSPADLLK